MIRAASQPALQLQTMNPHCMAVRFAAAAVKTPVTFQPTPDALEHLLDLSTLQRKELREAFAYCRGNPLLERRYEDAGRAVAELIATLTRMKAAFEGVQ